MKRALIIALIAGLWTGPAQSVEPDEILSDPALEARAREISKEVRCVVCQNEPIDSSDAGIARDLRILIRERLSAGDTDDEVFAYLVARYGDYVLFRPPLNARTILLWSAPFGALALGCLLVGLRLRNAQRNITKTAPPALSEDEARALDALLKERHE